MSKTMVHTHVHSDFSILDGCQRVTEIAARVKKLGQPAVALTDHGVIGNMLAFEKACRNEDIKHIHGIEVYLTENMREKSENRYHTVLLAKNNIGLSNIIKLSSFGFIDGFYYRPRIDLKILKEYKEDLIVTTACTSGLIPKFIFNEQWEKAVKACKWFMKYFPDDFYLELMPNVGRKDKDGQKEQRGQKKINEGLCKLSKELGIPLVATNDAHYSTKEGNKTHEVLLCISSRKTIDNPDRWKPDIVESYIKSREEMEKTFAKHYGEISKTIVKRALDNTLEIADKCETWIETKACIIPELPASKIDMSQLDFLKSLVKKAWKNKLIDGGQIARVAKKKRITQFEVGKIYKERVNMELKTIDEQDYASYFLVVWDLYKWVREQNIFYGPGRGSSAGSLVCYLLDITQIDPIEYDLLFERFLRPGRVTAPDIDMDFQDDRRDEVKQYLIDKWGKDCVANIGNYGTEKGKAALKDVGRVFGVPWQETQKVTNLVIQRSSGDARVSNTIEDTFKEFDIARQYDKKYPDVLKYAKVIEGRIRQRGVHASGVVIAPFPLIDMIPLERHGGRDTGVITTGLDWLECDELGLLKLDVLGLSTLTVIKQTLNLIESRTGRKIDMYNLLVDDPKVMKKFAGGNCIGAFQFDSIGMAKMCTEAPMENLNDIAIVNALYRPGGMRCISGDTRIQTSISSCVRMYKTMEEIYKMWSTPQNMGNNRGLGYKHRKQMRVVSVNSETRNLEIDSIISVECSGEKSVYSLKVRNYVGANAKYQVKFLNIKASLKHRFLCLGENNKFIWKEMKHINFGDYIAIKWYNRVGESWEKRKTLYEFQMVALFNYRCECAICGWDKAVCDVHHIDGNSKNNKIENLVFLCPNCHRDLEHNQAYSLKQIQLAQKKMRLPNEYNKGFRFVKVIEKVFEGKMITYDMEVEKNHNYIAGGFIVHNSGLAGRYLARKAGSQERKFIHPIYDNITDITEGCIVFQEQVMALFREMARWTGVEVDQGRKMIAKSHGVEELSRQRDHFVNGALNNPEYMEGLTKEQKEKPESIAETIFTTILHFGSYGFNRAHSAAYGLISYWTMYLKTYYPLEFYSVLISRESDDENISRFIRAMRKEDIALLPPDVNKSLADFSIEENGIRAGLGKIKNIGDNAIINILETRPFKNIDDLLGKVTKRIVNKRVVVNLIKAGAFDDMHSDRNKLLNQFLEGYGKKGKIKDIEVDVEPLDEEGLIRMAIEVLPIPPAKHILKYYSEIIDNIGVALTSVEETTQGKSRIVYMAGAITDIKYNRVGDFDLKERSEEDKKKEKNWGRRYANINLEDETGYKRHKFSPALYDRFQHIIEKGNGTPVIIKSKADITRDINYVIDVVDLDELRDKIRFGGEFTSLEDILMNSPLGDYKDVLEAYQFDEIGKVKGHTIKVAGIVASVKEHMAKNGLMAFISLEDGTGFIDLLIWADTYVEFKNIINSGKALAIKAVKVEGGKYAVDLRNGCKITTLDALKERMNG